VDVNGNPVTVLPTPLGPAIPIFSASTHSTVTGVTTGGFGQALSQIFHGTDPEFTFQLAMTLPIRNRVAEADNARALLVQRQDQTKLQATVNNITVDVQNAQILLRQDRASLAAAQKSRELQEQTLDAEQKKFQLGASTVFLVVTDQQALAVAAAAEVRAQVNLEEAKVNFERAMGRTLEVNNVTLANGKSGVVPPDSLIPGTTVTGALISTKPADGAMGLAK
jgi:outer membrane protein